MPSCVLIQQQANKSKTQEINAAKEVSEKAEKKAGQLEKQISELQTKVKEVCSGCCHVTLEYFANSYH